jgi:hypothetical protein
MTRSRAGVALTSAGYRGCAPGAARACRRFGSGDDRSSCATAKRQRAVQRDDRTVFVAVAFELLRHATMELRHEESDGPSELVPEQILPVQFAELLQRSAERTPELRLMAAVLEDAIRTFCRCSGSRGVRRQRLFRETADWFESSDVSWPFSFENICDALALEHGWVRRLLRRWQGAHTPSAHRLVKIPNVRRIAGSRHTITGRAPRLRDSRKLAS